MKYLIEKLNELNDEQLAILGMVLLAVLKTRRENREQTTTTICSLDIDKTN